MRTKELLIASAGALLLLGSCDVKDPGTPGARDSHVDH